MILMRFRSLFVLFLVLVTFVPVVHAAYVPYFEEYGIYRFDMDTQETLLVYSSPLQITNIDLSPDESMFVICMYHGDSYEYSEIYTINIDGSDLTRLTDNTHWDLYPNWSPDGSEFLYLSWRDSTLDIYKMDADGGNQRLLYDSGGHDADIDWVGDRIVFTRDSQIWIMNSDGSEAVQLTDPENAGVWGDAVLPFGDYDPRISPDETLVVFERMVDDSSKHGNYELFMMDVDGENEHNITGTGWTQGIAQWSSTGDELIYLVSAMGEKGRYDIFRINSDGTETIDLTSELFPEGFLAHHPIYAEDDRSIYFVGQWYGWERKTPSINLQLSTASVTLGEDVTITGSVNPIVHDIEFVVRTLKPSGVEEVSTLESQDGTLSYLINAHDLGEWTVTVEWAGDAGYESAVSFLSFTAVEEEETGGIPGFSVASALVGIVSVAMLRRWKLL